MRRTAWFRELRREPVVLIAAIVAVLLLAAAVLVPMVTGLDPTKSVLAKRLAGPSWLGGHGGLLGTDELGRDLFSLILYGLRTSFLVGGIATLLSAALGITVGVVAGYFGGVVDAILMRLTDIQLAIPGLLFVMTITRVLNRDTWTVILMLALISWMLYARVVRGAVLTLRSGEMVMSTTGLGATNLRILATHVLPNIAAPALAVLGVTFAQTLLAEASLSFLGYGVAPPQVSTGAILASGRQYLATSWWISTFAGLFLLFCVLSTNLIARWIQRVADPLTVRSPA